MNQDSGSVAGADSRTDQEEELGAAGAITVRPRSSIRFNLNWIEGSAGAPTSDLDIGCLFVLADGRRGAVQSVDRLDRSDGGLTSVPDSDGNPLIDLDCDDLYGSRRQGETLTVLRPRAVSFMVLFVSIYRGSSDFRSVGATITVMNGSWKLGMTRLSAPPPGLNWCAVLTMGAHDGRTCLVSEERYFRSAYHADRHYGFGLLWRAGMKPGALG